MTRNKKLQEMQYSAMQCSTSVYSLQDSNQKYYSIEFQLQCSCDLVYFSVMLYYSLLGRPRHRWEDGIKMDLREIGWGGVGNGFT
jgi:hypothetical protein